MKRTTLFIALASALSLPAYASEQAQQQSSAMGPKTQAALKEFQEEKGLQASGQLDSETIAALDLDQASSAASGGTSSSDTSSK